MSFTIHNAQVLRRDMRPRIGQAYYTRTSDHLYREDVSCAPAANLKGMCKWALKVNRHRGVKRTRWFFEKHFYTKLNQSRLDEIISEGCSECECSKAKQGTSADQGRMAHLPTPKMVNSMLYLDFTEMPKYGGHHFALLVTCGLSTFTRVFPLTKKCDGETMLKELFEGWF